MNEIVLLADCIISLPSSPPSISPSLSSPHSLPLSPPPSPSIPASPSHSVVLEWWSSTRPPQRSSCSSGPGPLIPPPSLTPPSSTPPMGWAWQEGQGWECQPWATVTPLATVMPHPAREYRMAVLVGVSLVGVSLCRREGSPTRDEDTWAHSDTEDLSEAGKTGHIKVCLRHSSALPSAANSALCSLWYPHRWPLPLAPPKPRQHHRSLALSTPSL